jgi:hypothetical protein
MDLDLHLLDQADWLERMVSRVNSIWRRRSIGFHLLIFVLSSLSDIHLFLTKDYTKIIM